jgi:hypothetical protein
MCRRLGRLFQLEANTTPGEFTALLYRDVEALIRANRELADEVKV